jgi:hypothetical protein
LDRPTLNNPKGGPLSGPGSEYLSQMAQDSLQKVDAARRYEFLRRKDDKDVEEKAETDNRILQIRRNFGWPFSKGLISDGDMQEDYERGWEGVPCCSFCGASHFQVGGVIICFLRLFDRYSYFPSGFVYSRV